MPKKSTKEKSSLSAAPKPKKTPVKRAATRKPAVAAKAAKASKPIKAPAAKKPAKSKAASKAISDGDIALRAYFIAERRQNLGWPGDEHSDWTEAKRQLEEEAAEKGL